MRWEYFVGRIAYSTKTGAYSILNLTGGSAAAVFNPAHGSRMSEEFEDFSAPLNILGSKGWELVSMTPWCFVAHNFTSDYTGERIETSVANDHQVVFKRPVAE